MSNDQTAPPVNPDDFHFIDRDEYHATYRVEGEITHIIPVQTPEAAHQRAETLMHAEDFCEPIKVETAELLSVRKFPRLYLVRRAGQDYSVSHLEPGDTPREPSEYEAKLIK